jgi:hypothetical protein
MVDTDPAAGPVVLPPANQPYVVVPVAAKPLLAKLSGPLMLAIAVSVA